jgi:preprotein translocase subunit SecF
MWVVTYRKIWYALSVVLIAGSFFAAYRYGFNLSIDFKGGEITEVSYAARPDKAAIEDNIAKLGLGGFSVRPSGEANYIIRTRELTAEEDARFLEALNAGAAPKVERQNSIGPTAGAELKGKAVKAVIVVILMIVLFITFAFRKVSRPVSSWKYGFATVIALAHDIIIPTGVFLWLGHELGVEIDLLFITGLLAILGYSVHDTIVVFDRVRENLSLKPTNDRQEFEQTVGASVAQTFGRSINTSLTIFITLLALYLYGSSATKDFSLLLLIGVVVGTYSSIFIASPLLVTFSRLGKKK